MKDRGYKKEIISGYHTLPHPQKYLNNENALCFSMTNIEITNSLLRNLIRFMPDLLTYTENFIKNNLKEIKYNEKITYNIFNDGIINKDLRLMTAGDKDFINCKVLGGVDSSVSTFMDGINILFTNNNMKIVSIFDAKLLTSLRTAVINGIALKYLSPSKVDSILLIGAGSQSIYQVPMIKNLFPSANLYIFDIDRNKPKELIKFLSVISNKNYNLKTVYDINEIIHNMDILITITPSRKPIIFKNQIKKGVHISALGADTKGKEEIDPEIIKDSKLVVDDIKQSVLFGELNVPYSLGILSEKNIYATLFEIVKGEKKGRENDNEITIFDSTGLALQDFIAHKWLYEKNLLNNF
jgi:ornithine cyclodeaminase/alanine dehydrogenase-like protein (mu-crystallin family)